MLKQNHIDIDNIWKIVKQVRKRFLSDNDDRQCQEDENQIANDDIKTNIDNVKKYLTINATDYESHENVIENILRIGAEIFTYISFCPPKKLIKFYKELLLQGSTKDIILAMTNIMKTRRNSEKSTSTKIWSEMTKKLKNMKYKNIDLVTLRNMNHYTDLNCTDQSCCEEIKSLG